MGFLPDLDNKAAWQNLLKKPIGPLLEDLERPPGELKRKTLLSPPTLITDVYDILYKLTSQLS